MGYPLPSLALFPKLLHRRQLHFPPYCLSRTSRLQSQPRPLQIQQSYHKELLIESHNEKRTIYALSTPPGRAGVAVIRISGPNALEVYYSMVTSS